ncbi:MAG TPA: alpha/beta hydrolase [Anaerolineae bacterium]|nr:alpha/beta hydrolase [Anaerolineae bacterium]
MPRVLVDTQPVYYRLSANDLTNRRPPLLLIHGAGGTHMHWPAALRRVPNWSSYALDLPGHGKSTGPGRDSIAAYRDVVYGFVQALGLERVVLAGHSMGGAIVQEFALHYPGRLAGIVLVGTGARLRVAPAILDGIRSDFPATARTIADWVHDKNTPPQLKRLYVQRTLENDPQVMYGDFYACDQFDRRADVARIETPALVVCGSNDVMTPPKFSESLAQSLPHARLALIPNAGHMVALEAPEDVTEAVADFLRTLGPFS